MKYLVLFMLSKKLPLLGPNKEREECIVLPAADTGGGGVTSAPSVPQSVFTITEKAPTRAFFWVKASSLIMSTDSGLTSV